MPASDATEIATADMRDTDEASRPGPRASSEIARPLVIYVTPVPDAATAEPTPDATASPTAQPTHKPTHKPSYAKLTSRSWKKVVKSPDDYTGKTYQVWACIFQFDAATGEDSFLGQASYKKLEYWWSDGENVSFTGDADRLGDFVEDDIVVMNVVGAGSTQLRHAGWWQHDRAPL